MQTLIEEIKAWFEQQAFGVCEWWGEKINIPSAQIRMFFIYTTFLTVGSPIILYLTLAFWWRLKDLIRAKRSSVFDL